MVRGAAAIGVSAFLGSVLATAIWTGFEELPFFLDRASFTAGFAIMAMALTVPCALLVYLWSERLEPQRWRALMSISVVIVMGGLSAALMVLLAKPLFELPSLEGIDFTRTLLLAPWYGALTALILWLLLAVSGRIGMKT